MFSFIFFMKGGEKMNKVNIFLKRHSSTILSMFASIGVIGTTILAIRATPKALSLIEGESENDKHGEKLTTIEKIKVCWRPYIPCIISGTSTILCIFGSNYINKKNQKALISAYMALNTTYLNYKNHVKDIYGDDANKNIQKSIIKSQEIDDKLNDEELFFDMQSMRYFTSSMDKIKNAEKMFNEYLSINGYAFLNDLYDALGLERVDYGYELGWSTRLNDKVYGFDGIILETELVDINDDIECTCITLSIQPSMDFIY